MFYMLWPYQQDWEPLSSQKKQAASAVEVFRIIEEVCHGFYCASILVSIFAAVQELTWPAARLYFLAEEYQLSHPLMCINM